MTNEFNFDVKHEDYKEWLNQIEQVSNTDCSLFSEPDSYTNCVRSPEIQKNADAKMDANGISMQAISLHTGYRRSRSKGKLAGQSIPSPDITKGKLISSANWNE